MLKFLTQTVYALVLAAVALHPANAGPKVLLETSLGNITLELDETKAPKTVANFLRYVDEGFYKGTVFHRIIDGFMVQGGGMDANLQPKPTHSPVTNEANNGLKNLRGSLAMARTYDPNSATAQFFINLTDNGFLDFQAPNVSGWGYAVFGRVIAGMDTVDKLAKLPTSMQQGQQDVPVALPVINRASRVTEPKGHP